MGASPPEHLHPQLAFGPGVEPALPCYVFLFGRSLASPLLFSPPFLGGGSPDLPPSFPLPFPTISWRPGTLFGAAWAREGAKKKENKIQAVFSGRSAALPAQPGSFAARSRPRWWEPASRFPLQLESSPRREIFIFSSLFSAVVEFPAESCPPSRDSDRTCCVLLLFVGGLVLLLLIFFFCWHYRASSKYFWLK